MQFLKAMMTNFCYNGYLTPFAIKSDWLMTIKRILIKNLFSSLLAISLSSACFAQNKQIAITIDDLPFVGEARNFHLNMIITTMQEKNIPATGFIIAKEVSAQNWEMLHKFRDAGFGLGNHTYSHPNLNKLQPSQYIEEIRKADDLLLPVLTEPKYFRYPYLAMSSGEKKDKILCYLAKKHYQVAPITIDTKDFAFNQRLLSVPEIDRRAYLNELKSFYLDFIWQQTLNAEAHLQYHHDSDQAQILLIHANLLNAYVLPDIINLYQQHGYTFITLEEALKTFKQVSHCSKPTLIKGPALLAKAKTKPPQDSDTFIELD